MLIGHYSVALGLKKAEPKASLGLLFLAVQLADILFFPLIALGIERASIIPNLTEAAHFRLDFAPYTHGLVGALVAGGLVFLIFRQIPAKQGSNQNMLALVMGVAVFSHWVLDVIVHTPDMALVDGGLPKIGLGLWNSALATYIVEAVIVLAGLWLYLRATHGTTLLAKYGMIGFTIVLLLFNIYNLYQPAPDPNSSLAALAIPALAIYFGFAGIAYWLDRKRSPRA